MGVQPMVATVTMEMKVLGGQSLASPIERLQNAVSFNYYANSTYYDSGMYAKAKEQEDVQKNINNKRREKIENS